MNYLSLQTLCQQLKANGFPKIEPSAIKNIYMPRLIRYLPIKPCAKILAAELLDRYNLGTGQCNLSRSELAGFLKMCISTISVAVRELEEKNIIFVTRAPRRPNGAPPAESNEYEFNWGLLLDKTQWSQERHSYQNHTYQNDTKEALGMKSVPSTYENHTNTYENHTNVGMKIEPSTYENHTLTREATSQSDKRNITRQETSEAYLLRKSPSARSSLREDLTSEDALEAAFEALVVVKPTPFDINDAEPTDGNDKPTGESDKPTEDPTEGSDVPYKDKKPRQLPITLIRASDGLSEDDLPYKNKKASPAPVMAPALAPVAQFPPSDDVIIEDDYLAMKALIENDW